MPVLVFLFIPTSWGLLALGCFLGSRTFGLQSAWVLLMISGASGLVGIWFWAEGLPRPLASQPTSYPTVGNCGYHELDSLWSASGIKYPEAPYQQRHLFMEKRNRLQGTVFWCPAVALPGERDRNPTSNEINTHHVPPLSFWSKLRFD